LNLSSVDYRVGRLSNVPSDINAVYAGFIGVIDSKVSCIDSRVGNNVAKGPNTVICRNGVVRKVKESLTADVAAEHSVGLVLEIVLFVVFFVRVDLGVREVESEIKEVIVVDKHLLNFRGRSAGPRRVSGVLAGLHLDYVLVVAGRGVLAFEVESCVQTRT